MPIIDVKHLKKTFKSHKKESGVMGSVKSLFARKYIHTTAVNDISFSIEEGELIGFIGQNGAGKTTTLKCLSGLIYPTEGQVSVLGHTPFKKDHSFLKQISLVMGQKNQLWWDLPPMESFLLNKEIYNVKDAHFKKTIDELSSLLDIKESLNIQVRKLSLGERMKCELIAALIHSPKVLFLDEPTIGLDVVMQQKLREFIREYNKKFNATIILTSHYMQDVKELCERVIIIDHGTILYDGPLDSIVKKYATHKILSIIFNKQVDKKELEKFGEVNEYEFPKATLAVPIAESTSILSKIISEYPVEDITIEDVSLEEIIRNIFTTSEV